MLSAVAARKARLQSQNASEPAPHSNPPLPTAPAPQPTSESTVSSPAKPTKSSSKRKPSSQGTLGPVQKKSKKTKGSRYFVTPQVGKDEFKTQDSIIAIPADGSDVSMDSGLGDYGEVDTLPEPVAGVRVPHTPRTPKGVLSPSAPLIQDSSDEDGSGEESVDEETADAPVVPLVLPTSIAAATSPVLSTFRSVFDQNTFSLSSSECQSLHIPHERALALVLSPSDTLALLGAYRLIVLRGSISINGVTLHPSETIHRVFAPRSSPIPIIEALAERGESSRHPSLTALPARVTESLGEHDSVVLLHELKTSVEGLVHVVRAFESSFKCTRKEEDQEGSDLGLWGVRLVRGFLHLSILSSTHIPSQLCHQSRDIQPFYLPHTWESAISSSLPLSHGNRSISTSNPSVSLVKGPKNSGKSAFARTLLSRLSMRYVSYQAPVLNSS